MSGQHIRSQQTRIDGLQDANLILSRIVAENAALQADRLYLASIVESSNDAIISMDMRGMVTSWNRAAVRMFGYTGAQIMGRPLAPLFPPDRAHEEDEIMVRIRTGEIVAQYETVRLGKDGTVLQVSITRDAGGDTVGVSKIIYDITGHMQAREDLKTLQAELVHLSRWNMMGMMASSLAHELNQPLTATLNYVQAARRTLKDAATIPRAREFLDQAVAETKLAGGIIRSLRAFIEKRDTNRLPEKLNEVLEEGLALSLYPAADSRSHIQVKLATGLPLVRIDRIQIQQVLLNLVRNSFEAMAGSAPDNSNDRLVIETALGEPGFVTVSVSDNGTGLSPEILNQLFQPFVTTKEKGMGVGLSICQALVEAHGGRIWTEPNLPQGVTFRFRLPILTEDTLDT